MTRRTLAASLFALAVVGCGIDGSGDITKAPTNWSEYAGDNVTVRGTAGNLATGPIVRLPYGGYVALNTTTPWSIQYVTRPVQVKGKIVSGAGVRTEPYVLTPDTIKIVDPETVVAETRPDAEVATPRQGASGQGR